MQEPETNETPIESVGALDAGERPGTVAGERPGLDAETEIDPAALASPTEAQAQPDWQPDPWLAAPHTTVGVAPASPPDRLARRQPRAIGTVVAAAVLSAALAAGSTFATIELTRPIAQTTLPTATATSASTAAAATQTPTQVSLTSTSTAQTIVDVAAAAKPSVVTITATGASGFSPFSVPSTGVGSGIIVSSGGLILTNYHVVEGSTSLTVTLDNGKEYSAQVVATDPTHDLAVIRASATGLTAATLGDSAYIEVGQLAIAIGSPLGTFTDTVTQGIVSGLNRTIDVSNETGRGTTTLEGLIQTDAAINPGNSGGPLLNSAGQVVGIITASASGAQGVGFAIPIDTAKALIQQASAA